MERGSHDERGDEEEADDLFVDVGDNLDPVWDRRNEQDERGGCERPGHIAVGLYCALGGEWPTMGPDRRGETDQERETISNRDPASGFDAETSGPIGENERLSFAYKSRSYSCVSGDDFGDITGC